MRERGREGGGRCVKERREREGEMCIYMKERGRKKWGGNVYIGESENEMYAMKDEGTWDCTHSDFWDGDAFGCIFLQ